MQAVDQGDVHRARQTVLRRKRHVRRSKHYRAFTDEEDLVGVPCVGTDVDVRVPGRSCVYKKRENDGKKHGDRRDRDYLFHFDSFVSVGEYEDDE